MTDFFQTKPTYEELEAQVQDLKQKLTDALTTVAAYQGKKNKDAAEHIYQAYPRKVGKGAAIKAINKALKQVPAGELLGIVKAYAEAIGWQEKRLIPHPATWFNQERWTDDPSEWKNPQQSPQTTPKVNFSL